MWLVGSKTAAARCESAQRLGFEVWGLGVWVQGLGFEVHDSWFRV